MTPEEIEQDRQRDADHANWAYFEGPLMCSCTIGIVPWRRMIGMAYSLIGEPGAVIWTEKGKENSWEEPAFVPTRYVHYVTSEAISSERTPFEWFKENLAGKGMP